MSIDIDVCALQHLLLCKCSNNSNGSSFTRVLDPTVFIDSIGLQHDRQQVNLVLCSLVLV